MRAMRRRVSLVLAVVLLAHTGLAWAGSQSSGSTPEQVAYGAGSALGTIVYSPVKASFCILGGVAGAFTALASPPTASKVVGGTCRGTWIITPGVLKGEDRVKFVDDGKS
jgi:hypothetical protein